MKVAFQGSYGSYSEEALQNLFKDKMVTPTPCDHSELVIEALITGRCELGLLPVENSIVGPVTLNSDLLYEHHLFIQAEYYLPIHHCLLALPGTKISDIVEVLSHPVALSQCHHYLKAKGFKEVASFDTAGSAEIIKALKAKNKAIVASKQAAKFYNLEILAENIANHQNNYTRFVVFAVKPPQDFKEANKTSLAFSVKHHPGALLNCLQSFKDEDINLTKIESRPIPENPFQYRFFVDVQASVESEKAKRALEKLKEDASEIRVLGSYQKFDLKL
jgi:prephenate dehydratase